MRRRSVKVRFISFAVLMAVFLPLNLFTSCTFLEGTRDEDACIKLVEDMLEDYFASPASFNWSRVCEPGYSPDPLDGDQAELLRYLAGKVKYSYTTCVFDDSGSQAKVTYEFKKLPDVRKMTIDEGTVANFRNEIKSLDTINLEVTFQVINSDGNWRFHSLSKFGKYFIHPFCDLKITKTEVTETTVQTTESSAENGDSNSIKDKYLASVWYGVETGNPLDELVVSDAYAVQNIFYFSEPVSGTFQAVLVDDSGKEILKGDFALDGGVTLVCDFSAGHEGWGTFDPGKYRVELSYQGQKIAVSDYLTVVK